MSNAQLTTVEQPLAVMVYHPYALVRAGIRRWLERQPPEVPARVAAETDDLRELVRQASWTWGIDLVVLPARAVALLVEALREEGTAPARERRAHESGQAEELGQDSSPGPAGLPPLLTAPQREVLALAAAGASYREAGQLLGKAHQTIKARLESARRRYGARTTTHAVALALTLGDLTPGDITRAHERLRAWRSIAERRRSLPGRQISQNL